MEKEQEHKQTVDETTDKFFEGLEAAGEQQPEGSPATEQAEETPEGGSDPQKTPSTEDAASYEGIPQGFRNHPAWLERENKLKEAKAKAEDLEKRNSVYSRLLDDPEVYAKYLQSQGFTKDEVRAAMAEKGFETKPAKENVETDKQAQAQSIAEKACQKLGWNINRLNPEQKSYLKDSVSLTMAILEDAMSSFVDTRLKPVEDYIAQGQRERQLGAEEQEVQAMAKEEFPDLDYKKEIEPAMHKYLDELDKKDPQGKIKISCTDLYNRATRDLLKERINSKARQDARDEAKKNQRPLTPGASIPRGKDNTLKGKNASETADKVLDSIGMKF